MANFNCIYCGYSIERNTKPLKCPYCGKKDAMEQEENADKIVSDA